MSAPWYAQAFDELYRELYAHRDQAEADRAIDWLGTRVQLGGRRVLDLAAGAGRHLHSLERHRARPIGVDLSRALLREALRAGGAAAGRLELARADLRRLPIRPDSCDGAISMFTSLGYFEVEAENRAVFAEVARAVRGGGFFLVDYLNVVALRRALAPTSERRVGRYRVRESRRIDAAAGRILKDVEIADAESGRTLRRYRESVALWERERLTAFLDAAGFGVGAAAGDYDGAPFRPEASPRLILLAERRG